MEWKNCKSLKLKHKSYRSGCSKTLNSMEPHKNRHAFNNDRILTRDDDEMQRDIVATKDENRPFCNLFK